MPSHANSSASGWTYTCKHTHTQTSAQKQFKNPGVRQPMAAGFWLAYAWFNKGVIMKF